ncbi:BON domain-containing protein [Fluoribacter dumoffii]|uniref:Osmotically-inducible protein Y n=1 Tax=Fluoribacter dumoffii TaxID=463 RepID=A0A377G8I0_9GAMM|nr:BON domain-containing protein [Fluoribacter dumoffii]KTC89668.1 lipoprotein [Fluoribacter dumoffii NY 23]MCW8384862.1 BON domain-containing protein [Fluoribacter dumoffii]MCW8417924.1 BON domain-containing protein [Fluoribacter dumoffii]MCW8454234.1 BON domain-containing protein [Fluoribacter dumoffii]MCW8461692.1 BON domain-containing protein [Fluoribacter dumoffii]
MRNSLKMLFVGLLSIIIIACVASPGTESTGEFLDSSTTTAKVKATLVNQLGRTGLAVQVKTFKDEVQLSGFVATPGLKQRAGIIAANVDGVRTVRNDIIVRP